MVMIVLTLLLVIVGIMTVVVAAFQAGKRTD